jgi:hypothetical protein
MVLKRDGVRFSSAGVNIAPFKCGEHLSGSSTCEVATADCNDPSGTGQATVAGCCDPTSNEWTFQTCDFSEFLLGGVAADLIPGKGSSSSDCLTEWIVKNPQNVPSVDRHGFPNWSQTCTDGDALCDADGEPNGTCVFQVAVCINVDDARLDPACVPSDLQTWEVKKPRPNSPKARDAANATALRDALHELGTGTIGGVDHERVTFEPPLTSDACTDLVGITVPLRGSTGNRKGVAVFRTKASEAPSRRRDGDVLKLTCLPAR